MNHPYRVVLVTGSIATRDVLEKQLYEYFTEEIMLSTCARDEGETFEGDFDLMIFSSRIVYDELIDTGRAIDLEKSIIGTRHINFDLLHQLAELPVGSQILFVNDMKETAEMSVEMLKTVGFDYLDYSVYYPGAIFDDKCENAVAVTPGERVYVPGIIENIIDIGPRIFDFKTIYRIIKFLELPEEYMSRFSDKYLEKIIRVNRKLVDSRDEIDQLNDHLKVVLNGLSDGLLAYDSNGRITVFNEKLKRLLKPRSGVLIGKKLNSIIYNIDLLTFLTDPRAIDHIVLTIDTIDVQINKVKLQNDGATLVCFSFDGNKPLAKAREINISKGLYGKYTLENIVGDSEEIIRAKSIVEKLAHTDMSILIHGESGTGKELFASALHNCSTRKAMPYLAVNFSALPDDLIESELFGYEDGAFTGAKKGGKKGLFEEAEGGTIFLDEIGDISLKVQARLLRVLEEKEIMRVGGNAIMPVNVRVIAATNKNLSQLVHEGVFREDLFYRLKMGYIKIPPLRERREDIRLITEHIVKTETVDDITISDDVFDYLSDKRWEGNVRELKNTILYMLAVKKDSVLILDDLPAEENGHRNHPISQKRLLQFEEVFRPDIIDSEILGYIEYMNNKNELVGRKRICQHLVDNEIAITESKVRRRLEKLERQGLLVMGKGKVGTQITAPGKECLMVTN